MRAHYAAHGVEVKPGTPKEVLLSKYFLKERLIRFLETMCQISASLGLSDELSKNLRLYQKELFPEIGLEEKDFVSESSKVITALEGKAFVIGSTDGVASMGLVDEDKLPQLVEEVREGIKVAQDSLKERWIKKYGVEPK